MKCSGLSEDSYSNYYSEDEFEEDILSLGRKTISLS